MHKKLARNGEGGREGERDGEGGRKEEWNIYLIHIKLPAARTAFSLDAGLQLPSAPANIIAPHPQLRGRFLPKMASAAAKTQTAFF